MSLDGQKSPRGGLSAGPFPGLEVRDFEKLHQLADVLWELNLDGLLDGFLELGDVTFSVELLDIVAEDGVSEESNS